MGRNTSDVYVFCPSQGYQDFVIKFLAGQNPVYAGNMSNTGTDLDLIEKIKEESIKDAYSASQKE